MTMNDSHSNAPDSLDAAPRRPLVRILGILLIVVSVVAAIYLVVAYLAWEDGRALRDERSATLQAQQLEHQIELAQDDIAGGSYTLALDRLDWILERDPGNSTAEALRQQAEAALRTALTPDAPPTATPRPEPTPTPGAIADPAEELARLQRLHDRQEWERLVQDTLVFQRQLPEYERLETDGLLYDGYLNLGLTAVQGTADEVEKGLYYLAQAETLGNLPQEGLDYRFWAELYLEGIAYYGVNWGVASSVLRELCLSAPFYQGACDKFFDSLVNYADQFAFAQDWCPAVDLYREARQVGNAPGLSDKLNAAVEGCASATPTPAAITDTVPITGTESLNIEIATPPPGE